MGGKRGERAHVGEGGGGGWKRAHLGERGGGAGDGRGVGEHKKNHSVPKTGAPKSKK